MKYLVVVFILTMPAVFSCNPAKQVSKQQKQYNAIIGEYLKDHPVRIDTTTKYIKGEDSSSFYKHIADSLDSVKQIVITTIATQYKDTCTSANDIFFAGYDAGTRLGKAKAKQLPGRVDTVKTHYLPVDLINTLQQSVATLTNEKNTIELKAANNKKWFWLFIISCILNLLLLTALLIKIFKK